jgi:hypothetical protein
MLATPKRAQPAVMESSTNHHQVSSELRELYIRRLNGLKRRTELVSGAQNCTLHLVQPCIDISARDAPARPPRPLRHPPPRPRPRPLPHHRPPPRLRPPRRPPPPVLLPPSSSSPSSSPSASSSSSSLHYHLSRNPWCMFPEPIDKPDCYSRWAGTNRTTSRSGCLASAVRLSLLLRGALPSDTYAAAIALFETGAFSCSDLPPRKNGDRCEGDKSQKEEKSGLEHLVVGLVVVGIELLGDCCVASEC